jgi:hypothetical protein
MEIEQRALEYIKKWVSCGFCQPVEIERIVGHDRFRDAISRERMREMVEAEAARQKAEQESWPEVTDCDRLDQAFAA